MALILVAAFAISRGCQQSDITQDEAVEIATEQVDFRPTETQVRLLRQGAGTVWFVSLSIPIGGADSDRFRELAVVRINPDTGEVLQIDTQPDAEEPPQP